MMANRLGKTKLSNMKLTDKENWIVFDMLSCSRVPAYEAVNDLIVLQLPAASETSQSYQ